MAGQFCRQRDKGAGSRVNPGTWHVLFGFPMTRACTRWQRVPEPSAVCGMSLAADDMEIPPPTGRQSQDDPISTISSVWSTLQQGLHPMCVSPFLPFNPVRGMVGCCSITDSDLLIGAFFFLFL